ncbi:NAD(+) kinase [Candidatus Methylopumilus planktonicus]|uniref:NAD(+) kinase n=1 Tax=Candidatus Methylopumilus planktonicus TaxID=1581557 RepID=UPI001123668E|nr:NAD(+) kinase [Candidatus Methylopumilus planktonicus]QDD07192.1 NAD(+) kinase [Candidatus Methylopumilus planktonicus]QDD08521.1 NAD(+) kinase [Candidatus Methylopumilus planktonicus]QDD09844.1 NAD(+) kinase [Candidatus Methylopumilus planktonicus]
MESLFKSVAIIGKYASGSKSSDIESQLLELAQYLTNKHINIFIEAKTHQSGKFQAFKAINLEEIGEKADLAIVLGGDGTMLGVARSLVNFDIPLIGINQGRFGFLADLNTSNMFESIDEIFQGSSYKDKRMLLQSKIFRDSKCIHEALALNDVVVRSGSRLIELEVSINGSFVHKQRSDGLVVTTPTGTTAYALSAGGPILHPELEAISIVPISPHTLSNRPIAVSSNSAIEIHVVSMDESYLSIDGQLKVPLELHDRIEIIRAEKMITFLHPKDYCYFEMLRKKLNWG